MEVLGARKGRIPEKEERMMEWYGSIRSLER